MQLDSAIPCVHSLGHPPSAFGYLLAKCVTLYVTTDCAPAEKKGEASHSFMIHPCVFLARLEQARVSQS